MRIRTPLNTRDSNTLERGQDHSNDSILDPKISCWAETRHGIIMQTVGLQVSFVEGLPETNFHLQIKPSGLRGRSTTHDLEVI
jgi:hypothetical protein